MVAHFYKDNTQEKETGYLCVQGQSCQQRTFQICQTS